MFGQSKLIPNSIQLHVTDPNYKFSGLLQVALRWVGVAQISLLIGLVNVGWDQHESTWPNAQL